MGEYFNEPTWFSDRVNLIFFLNNLVRMKFPFVRNDEGRLILLRNYASRVTHCNKCFFFLSIN